MAALFAHVIRMLRWVAHVFVPKGISPERYRRLMRSIYKRLIYDPGTQTVLVRRGPLKDMVKCGPFKEADFDFALGHYECETMDAICRFCRPGMTVFDIGANAGYLTLLMARQVGDLGYVHAFEPIAESCNYLSLTMRANGLRNVTLHQLAVSDRTGEAWMNYSGVFDGFATIADGGHDYYRGRETNTISVATVSLDQFCSENGLDDVGFIKIDIEGSEMLALAGMSHVLSIHRPVLITEFWGTEHTVEGPSLLRRLGYETKLLSSWSGYVRGARVDIHTVLGLPIGVSKAASIARGKQ